MPGLPDCVAVATSSISTDEAPFWTGRSLVPCAWAETENRSTSRSARQHQELQDLNEIEAGVAHHRCRDGSPPKIDRAPERSQRRRGHCGIRTLDEVTGAERHARHNQTNTGSTQPAFETPLKNCL